MTTEQGTIYVADDGEKFINKRDCIYYELCCMFRPYLHSIPSDKGGHTTASFLTRDSVRPAIPAVISKLQEYIKE